MKVVSFQCTYCGKLLSVEEQYRGAEAECPFCGKSVIIPQQSHAPAGKVPVLKKSAPHSERSKLCTVVMDTVLVTLLICMVIGGWWINRLKKSSAFPPRTEHAIQKTAPAVPGKELPAAVRKETSPAAVRKETPVAVRKETPVVVRKETPVVVRKETPVAVRKENTIGVRPVMIHDSDTARTPEQLCKEYIANASEYIRFLEFRIAKLPPVQQNACRRILSQIKKLQDMWPKRLEYLKQRNVKIKEVRNNSYDQESGHQLQKEFAEYTKYKSDWGYNSKCIEFSQRLAELLQNPQVDPNIKLEDVRYPRFSGPAIKAISSGRIIRSENVRSVLISRFADPACLYDRTRLMPVRDHQLIKYGLPSELIQKSFDNLINERFFREKDLASVALLLCDGAVPNADHLSAAVLHSRPEVVALLLARGVDPNELNKNDETALFNAYRIAGKSVAIRALLLAGGVDPAVRNGEGKTAQDMESTGLFLAAWSQVSLQTIEKYFKEGVSPDMELPNGRTLLQDACTRNELKLVEILFKYKVDPRKRGKGPNVPLAISFRKALRGRDRKALHIFRFMVEHGASILVNPVGYGGTNLLCYAIRNYHWLRGNSGELIEFMLKHTGDFKENDWKSVRSALYGVRRRLPDALVRKIRSSIPEDL